MMLLHAVSWRQFPDAFEGQDIVTHENDCKHQTEDEKGYPDVHLIRLITL